MDLLKHKRLLWLIALCFALMQTMAPFIHGHLEADRNSHTHGIHFHPDDHKAPFADSDGHFVHDSTHVSHTIAIATGIKKDQDQNALIGLAILLITLVFGPRSTATRFSPLAQEPRFKPLFRRRPSSPRAPPHALTI